VRECHPSVIDTVAVPQPITTRLITAAARDVLRPLGLVQKGRSRTWLGDQAWWLLVVSFDPSGFEKGSYLDVSATWLWNERDYISFDVGGRTRWIRADGSEVGGISYDSDEQFAREARRMVEAASAQVELYRSLFVTLQDCAHYYATHPDVTIEQYPDAGIAHGLVGKRTDAVRWFDAYLGYEDDREWAIARRKHVRALKELLQRDLNAFRAEVWSLIDQKRERFKLPQLSAAERPRL
jgi:hypothetical protein